MPDTAIIGAPLDRVDGPRKVTGAATYAAEFSMPGLVHAVLVQSNVTAGDIVAIDTRDAEGMPGVIAVITPDNAERLKTQANKQQAIARPTLQDRTVLFNGQHVAVVVADTLDRAQDAAGHVRLRYRQGEALIDMQAALDQAYVPKEFRGGTRSPDSRRGDPDSALRSASVVVDETYTTPVEHHNPMEPHATIAAWNGDRLNIWTSTQGVGGAQMTMARMFGIPLENVSVMSPFLGGGFGSKGNTWPPVTLAAMAARKVGRPVKLVLSRRQMYTSNGYRPRTIQHLKLAADADGRLVALRHDSFTQNAIPVLGEYSEGTGLASEMLYACDNVAVSHRLVAVNQSLPTYMRAPGEAPGVFALESAMDELAGKLRIDPIELRLRNYADQDGHEGKPFSSKKLRECYAQGAEAFGWRNRSPEPRSMRDGHRLVGWGFATSTYPTNRQGAGASVTLHADGTAVVRSGTQDIGTGTYTVMTQVAAETLGLPVSRVRFELGDSAFPPAPVSGGSQTVASVAPAVQAAAKAAREKVIDLALNDPRFAGASRADIGFRNGIVSVGSRRADLAALLARTGQTSLQATAMTDAGDGRKAHSPHAFGAQFAEVMVDPELGEIRVTRYVGAFDAGRVMNAKTARSQLIGGITYGIGMALLEETLVDPDVGRIVNANLSEYLVPVHADVPYIRTILVENDDRISNPLGAKGIGELPMVGVAAAIANAVCHATGVRVRDLPIRPEMLLRA